MITFPSTSPDLPEFTMVHFDDFPVGGTRPIKGPPPDHVITQDVGPDGKWERVKYRRVSKRVIGSMHWEAFYERVTE